MLYTNGMDKYTSIRTYRVTQERLLLISRIRGVPIIQILDELSKKELVKVQSELKNLRDELDNQVREVQAEYNTN